MLGTDKMLRKNNVSPWVKGKGDSKEEKMMSIEINAIIPEIGQKLFIQSQVGHLEHVSLCIG